MKRTSEAVELRERQRDKPAVLIYDGECGLCGASVRWVQRNSRPGAIEYLVCQSLERRQRFPDISVETCMEAIVLVLPDGRRLMGSDAAPHVLRRMRSWRWLSYLFAVPGVRLLAPPVYAWIARNRGSLSCTLRRGAS